MEPQIDELEPPMHADGRRLNVRAATSRVPWANPVCPWLGVALQRNARASEALAHGTRTGALTLFVAIALGACGAVCEAQFVTAPRQIEPAHRGDLITEKDVAWHVEALGLDEAAARQVETLAEKVNAETARAVEAGLELVRWCETLDPTSRALLYPGASRSRFWFESHDAEFAAKAAVNGAEYQYFQSLYPLVPDQHATVEELYFTHICARLQDSSTRRPAQLREILERMLPDKANWPDGLREALAAHERERAAIALELQQLQASNPHTRREAWLADDIERFIAAQAAYVNAQYEERDITKEAAARIAMLLPEPQRGEFVRQFRRFHYRSVYPRAVDAIERALARPDVPDHLRRSLEALKRRAEMEFDPLLDEKIEAFERTFSLEWSLSHWEKNDRLRWRGEAEDTIGPPLWEEYQEAGRTLNESAQRVQSEFAEYESQFPPPPVDPEARIDLYGGYVADVPPHTDVTWRFYYLDPVFGRPDLERMLDACEATDDQRTLARAIYDDYRRQAHEKAVEFGRAVTELNRRQEEFKRENPDSGQGVPDDLTYEYSRLDSQWSNILTDLDLALWNDVRALLDSSQQNGFKRAVLDAHWEKSSQHMKWHRDRDKRHLVAVVEEAFADSFVPPECRPILAEYHEEAVATSVQVRRTLMAALIASGESVKRREARGNHDEQEPTREQQEMMSLYERSRSLNARYRGLLLAAASDSDRDILQRAFDRETYPDLFMTSPIDLLARELDEAGAGRIESDRLAAAEVILDGARAQLERNTQALIAARAQWSGPESEPRWARWRENHPPPGPEERGVHQEGPMDQLWDQRLTIAKNACAQVARLFPVQDRSTLPPAIELIFHWSEGK